MKLSSLSLRRMVLALGGLSLMATTVALQAQTPSPRLRNAAPPVAAPSLPPASDEQKEVATRVHTGEIACEAGQIIRVRGHASAVGYIDVSFARQTYVMKPVQSPTGAIRLEDVQGTALMLQLGNKSMLMNVKVGQRLADECVHPVQKEATEAAARAAAEARARGEAPRGLFDAPASTPTVVTTPANAAALATPAPSVTPGTGSPSATQTPAPTPTR